MTRLPTGIDPSCVQFVSGPYRPQHIKVYYLCVATQHLCFCFAARYKMAIFLAMMSTLLCFVLYSSKVAMCVVGSLKDSNIVIQIHLS